MSSVHSVPRAGIRRNRCVRGLTLLLMAAIGWVFSGSLAAQEAPIQRRFEVHRTAQGFELRGYRAEVGAADRFTLSAGMAAGQARAQMRSVRWGETYGLEDSRSAQLWGSRVRYRDVVETVAVILDPTGQTVQTVAYEWRPAWFSRFGLGYYAAFGEGRVLADEESHVVMEYGPRGGQRLRVEATRQPGSPPNWRIVFRMDAVAGAAAG
jgi:hypothetical protein